MLRFRIFNSVIILCGVWILNFFLSHLSPGDASNLYLSPGADRASLEALRQQRGLEQPLHQQFSEWTRRFFSGDFGYSWARHRPVAEILQEAIPATLQLTAAALLLNLALGCFFNLLEPEIYGYEKGAFTDAKARKKGRFELGIITMIHPDELTPATLQHAVEKTARQNRSFASIEEKIDLNGLRRVEQLTQTMC